MKNITFRDTDGVLHILLERRDTGFYGTAIDDEDLAKVEAYPGKWYASFNESKIYAQGNHKKKSTLLHRLLMDFPEGLEVDHIDGDGLNNRRSTNLRAVDRSTNAFNRQGANRNNKTGIRGIYWHEKKRCYRVQYRADGRRRELTGFKTVQEADRARREFLGTISSQPMP